MIGHAVQAAAHNGVSRPPGLVVVRVVGEGRSKVGNGLEQSEPLVFKRGSMCGL